MKIYTPLSILIIIILLTIVGCSKKENDGNTKNSTNSTDANYRSVITNITPELLKKIIYDRKGKILIVTLWSTWSGKSMKQITDMNGLFDEYGSSKADFAAIDIDPATDINSKVLPFIRDGKFKIPVYTVDALKGKEILKMLNPQWNGNIPVTYIYDKKGLQKEILQGIQTSDYLAKEIISLSN